MNGQTGYATITAAVSSAGVLDQARVAHFQQHGWVHVPGFFDAQEVRELQSWTDELAARPQLPGADMVYLEQNLLDPGSRVVQRIEYFCRSHAGFDVLLNRGRLSLAASQLLDEPVCLFKEKINFKYSGGGGFEPHQDQQAGWSAYAPIFLSVLVGIDQATVENGCLEIAVDQPARLRTLIGEEWKPLQDGPALRYQAVPTAPGDAIFFDSYVPHRSNPNLTASPRRILYASYNAQSHGEHREQYFRHKRANFPPDCEREAGRVYEFKV